MSAILHLVFAVWIGTMLVTVAIDLLRLAVAIVLAGLSGALWVAALFLEGWCQLWKTAFGQD